jgi:hypothetical protein
MSSTVHVAQVLYCRCTCVCVRRSLNALCTCVHPSMHNRKPINPRSTYMNESFSYHSTLLLPYAVYSYTEAFASICGQPNCIVTVAATATGSNSTTSAATSYVYLCLTLFTATAATLQYRVCAATAHTESHLKCHRPAVGSYECKQDPPVPPSALQYARHCCVVPTLL